MLFEFLPMRFLPPQSFVKLTPATREAMIEQPIAADKPFSRRRPATRSRRGRLGAATVELALVAPFVFFIIFGSVEFGRMMMVKQALTNAAREGCRHASLATVRDHESSETLVRDLLKSSISSGADEGVVQVTFTPAFHSSPEQGTEILVCVEVNCADISWIPETLFAGAKVRGVACMNRE